MNFQDAETKYRELKAQHDAGKLSDADFEVEVGKLRLQDEQGRWWQIGVQTGDWYVHDGQKWNKQKPPTAMSTPPPPAPVVEKPAAPSPVVEKKPDAPKVDKPKGGSSLPARLFSSKPAGRDSGLSRPVLIGIIAGVAIIILLLLIGGYFVINNVLGVASAKPTMTPTRAIAILPSPTVPVVLPTLRPTDTPLPPPSPIVTATVPLTITAPTRTRAPASAATATATRRPVTPTVTVPNVPPGVYATKLETIPPKVNLGDQIGFKLTLLNTTGTSQTYTIMIKVYKCPEQCEEFKSAYGETLRASFTAPPGTSTFTSSQNINIGIGISCDLVAIPHYIDPTNQAVIPFKTTNNNALYQGIKVCQ
jgi:hypothetical protein